MREDRGVQGIEGDLKEGTHWLVKTTGQTWEVKITVIHGFPIEAAENWGEA